MKTIKTIEVPNQGFEITEQIDDIVQDPLTGRLVNLPKTITHKVSGKFAIIDNEVYFGYYLHDLPPYPSMEIDSTFQGTGQDPLADNKRFYLRKGSWRERPIIEEGEVVGVEDYYQPHCKEYVNHQGVTYIKFDDTFAGGKFKRKAEFILENKSKVLRANRKKATIDAKFPDLSWL